MVTHRLQTTIFPDRHTLEIRNPTNGEWIPVDEITAEEWHPQSRPFHPESKYWSIYTSKTQGIHSHSRESLDEFASVLAVRCSPFRKMRPADYTLSMF